MHKSSNAHDILFTKCIDWNEKQNEADLSILMLSRKIKKKEKTRDSYKQTKIIYLYK